MPQFQVGRVTKPVQGIRCSAWKRFTSSPCWTSCGGRCRPPPVIVLICGNDSIHRAVTRYLDRNPPGIVLRGPGPARMTTRGADLGGLVNYVTWPARLQIHSYFRTRSCFRAASEKS